MTYTVLTPTVYDAALSAVMGAMTQGRDITQYTTGRAGASWNVQASVATAIAQQVDTTFGVVSALTTAQQATLRNIAYAAFAGKAPTDVALPPNSYAAAAVEIANGYAATATV